MKGHIKFWIAVIIVTFIYGMYKWITAFPNFNDTNKKDSIAAWIAMFVVWTAIVFSIRSDYEEHEKKPLFLNLHPLVWINYLTDKIFNDD